MFLCKDTPFKIIRKNFGWCSRIYTIKTWFWDVRLGIPNVAISFSSITRKWQILMNYENRNCLSRCFTPYKTFDFFDLSIWRMYRVSENIRLIWGSRMIEYYIGFSWITAKSFVCENMQEIDPIFYQKIQHVVEFENILWNNCSVIWKFFKIFDILTIVGP